MELSTVKKKKMINALVDKEIGFLLQNEENLLKRLKCKYRNMPKKLLKTYYRDNISHVLLGDGIWVDTKNGYKVMTVDQDSKPDFSWIYEEDDDYVQMELF